MHPFHSRHQYHGYKFASKLSKHVDLADDLNDMRKLDYTVYLATQGAPYSNHQRSPGTLAVYLVHLHRT